MINIDLRVIKQGNSKFISVTKLVKCIGDPIGFKVVEKNKKLIFTPIYDKEVK